MRLSLFFALLFAAGCSSGSGDGPINCGFEGSSFAPLKVGYTWQYQITDSDTGETDTPKQQRIDREEAHEVYGDVFFQVTEKTDGKTENILGIRGDQVLRFEERKFDAGDDLPKTTTKYDPHRIRVDQSVGNLTAGATYEDRYDAIEFDRAMTEVKRETRVDRWKVVSSEAECVTSLGISTCLHVTRTRFEIVGSVENKKSTKGFFFAEGVGKVIEAGNKREELSDCEAL